MIRSPDLESLTPALSFDDALLCHLCHYVTMWQDGPAACSVMLWNFLVSSIMNQTESVVSWDDSRTCDNAGRLAHAAGSNDVDFAKAFPWRIVRAFMDQTHEYRSH